MSDGRECERYVPTPEEREAMRRWSLGELPNPRLPAPAGPMPRSPLRLRRAAVAPAEPPPEVLRRHRECQRRQLAALASRMEREGRRHDVDIFLYH